MFGLEKCTFSGHHWLKNPRILLFPADLLHVDDFVVAGDLDRVL